jgi:hypothetical protein
MGYLPPNFHIFGKCDAVIPFVIWPLSADRTRVAIHLLFPLQVFRTDRFDEKIGVYREFQIAVVEEDRAMVEGMQKNLSSPLFRPGPMSRFERPVHHIIDAYLKRLNDCRVGG